MPSISMNQIKLTLLYSSIHSITIFTIRVHTQPTFYVRSAVNGQQNCHRLTVLTAVKPFQTFLVIRHLSEVSTLSGQGIYPYLFHYKTALAFSEFLNPLIYWHSLRSAFRSSS